MLLYKYYDESFLTDVLSEHIIKPQLKLSQTIFLNDPFESLLSNEIETLVRKKYHHLDKALGFPSDKMIAELKSVLNTTGVCSMSECNKNLLMWSHYSEHHKGVVIAYDCSDLQISPLYTFHTKDDLIPKRVVYRDLRNMDESHLEKLSKEQYGSYRTYLDTLVLTKSNHWIYEKEHRLVLPIFTANEVKIFNDKNDTIRKELIRLKGIKEEQNRLVVSRPLDEESRDFHLKRSELNYFIDINPKSIKSVYFGVRSTMSTEKLNSIIKPNSRINFFRSVLDKKQYQLNFKRLN